MRYKREQEIHRAYLVRAIPHAKQRRYYIQVHRFFFGELHHLLLVARRCWVLRIKRRHRIPSIDALASEKFHYRAWAKVSVPNYQSGNNLSMKNGTKKALNPAQETFLFHLRLFRGSGLLRFGL